MVYKNFALGFLIILLFIFFSAFIPNHLHSPLSVISTINTLRASYGLPYYAVDDLLMLAAQGQADYLASIGPKVGNGHVGLGGTDADARALAVGYPYVQGLDINENWAAIPLEMSIEALIATGWSDEAHMHTMLHERGQHIGVGVSISGNIAYIVVNVAAYWGDAGLAPQPTNSIFSSSLNSGQAVSNFISPVIKAEPKEDGSIVHIVQSGQSLWMLAHHYDVEINRIKELNDMGNSDVIHIGQEILIQPSLLETDTPITITSTPLKATISSSEILSDTLVPTISFEIEEKNLPDWNIYFLVIFILFGVGLILVVISAQHR